MDDELHIARVLRTGLRSQGYEARVANDGETAFDGFKAWKSDVIVTDLVM